MAYDKKKALDRLKLIRELAESDAKALDGQPFSGKTMATEFGKVYAAIDALAATMLEVMGDDK